MDTAQRVQSEHQSLLSFALNWNPWFCGQLKGHALLSSRASRCEKMDSSVNAIRLYGLGVSRTSLPKGAEQSLDLGPLRRGRRQAGQQVARRGLGVRTASGPRVGEREVEARFVEVRIGGERGGQRLDCARQIAFRSAQDA